MSRTASSDQAPHPRYVVWELTLKCDLACRHCGSRAGRPRAEELRLDEALSVVAQLAALGTCEITFIGGEAYLAPDWLTIVRAAADAGIRCSLTTGARAFDLPMARRAREAGLAAVSVSVDGLEQTHDRLRAVPGSWNACMRAIDAVAAVGLGPLANTQFNQLNLPEIEGLADVLVERGVRRWQVQLTGPMGRAADRSGWLLQPWQMLDLIPRLRAVADRVGPRGLQVEAANNLGYFGPHEHVLRRAPWQGCVAGRFVLGIESNGDVKACPSLPSAPYVGGNVRHRSIADIVEHSEAVRFSRDRGIDELWGFCARCYYAKTCRGGCSWTAHTLLGRRGNMPYCFHRAEQLAAEGVRECIEPVEAAPGEPFDFGRYRLVEEPTA